MPKQQLPAALAEAGRVLAPGAVLAVTMKAGTTEGFEPNRRETWAEPRFFARYEGGELAAALEQAGFSRVSVSPPASDERGEPGCTRSREPLTSRPRRGSLTA